MVNPNGASNGNGSGEYQPEVTYEHLGDNDWAKVNEETGEGEIFYDLSEEFADDEDTETNKN